VALDRLDEVLASLLIFAQSVTGYAPLDDPPQVSFVPHVELERAACSRPCKIYGWYPLGRTIYLDDRLDPVHDAGDRSILLHELVHYLQQAHGAFTGGSECEKWSRRELEAYRVQARWLTERRVVKLLYSGIGPAPWTLACGQEASAPPDIKRESDD
jgi:Domain of unknown function (DUF6647)